MYIDAIKGSLIALVVFVIAVWLIPTGDTGTGAEIILTVSTFLFAILAGFYISRLNVRYNHIKKTIAEEDALWLSLYKCSKIYGNKFQNKIRNIIDDYYVSVFEFIGLDYYKSTSKIFFKIYEELYKLKKYKNDEIYSKMFDYMNLIEMKRNDSSVHYREKLSKGQWAIMFILVLIIILSIFSLRTYDIYFSIITILLCTILVLILLIIRDLENLRLGGKLILVESGQEVLEFIGKKRYYNRTLLKTGSVTVPRYAKDYRVGEHKIGEKPRIKIEKNPKYNKEYEKKYYSLDYN